MAAFSFSHIRIRVSASVFLLPPPWIAADGGAATLAAAFVNEDGVC